MRVLLDTHSLLWWVTDSDRLNRRAREVLADGENELYLSAISTLEIAIKWKLGKLTLPDSPERFVVRIMAEQALLPLAIRLDHTLALSSLRDAHRDPFDRVLICQSLIEKLPILTADEVFRKYDVDLIWSGKRKGR